MSVSLKIMVFVVLTVTVIAGSNIVFSTMKSLDRTLDHDTVSQLKIIELVAAEQGSNIKFNTSGNLELRFKSLIQDPDLSLFSASAFDLSGKLITQVPSDDSAIWNAHALALVAIRDGSEQTLTEGTKYYAAVPVYYGKAREQVGAVVVAWDAAGTIAQAKQSALQQTFLATGITLLSIGALALLLHIRLSRPLKHITQTAEKIAAGNYEIPVEYTDRTDELGKFSRAVEIFRTNGKKIQSMTKDQAAAAKTTENQRLAMMQQLRTGFFEVVEAAVAGDFSKRIDAKFEDEEINSLATTVNELIETVDRGLTETANVLSAIADTDLTKRVEGFYAGSFESLKDDTNAVGNKLHDIVSQLRVTSQALKSATGDMRAGATDLSQRTTQQAAAIQETSASMGQISTAVSENARQAEKANTIVHEVSTNASESSKVMQKATNAMERINASSSRITSIIGLIDNVAFQTNLLALNASVEAARAGDAGKGFAVVADEVRRLAQSAASASAEISELVEQSENEVKSGTELVSSASTKLDAMIAAVAENSEMMISIMEECREQASLIEEVNASIRRMDEMTQHNAALVEETNAAVEKTGTQSETLDEMVEIFTIRENPEDQRRTTAHAFEQDKISDMLDSDLEQREKTRSPALNGNLALEEDWSEF